MSNQDDQLKRASWLMAVAVLSVLVIAQQFVHDQETEELLNHYEVSNRGITQCLPDDEGVVSLLSLQRRGDGLFLNCEKHAKYVYGQARDQGVKYSMAVPVSVE